MIINIFKSECRKLKRSPLLYLYILILFFSPVLGFYYKDRAAYLHNSNIYVIFYEILAITSPIIISIVVCLIFDREETAGKFKNWFSTPVNKTKLMQLQLIFYWLLYFIEVMFSSFIFYFITSQFSPIPIQKLLYLSALFSILSLALYQITFIFSLKWGVGGALVIGIFGVILSLLGITSLFDTFWFLLPWTWQIRTIIFWQSNIPQMIINISIVEYLLCLGLLFLISMVAIIICKKWEG